MSKTKKIWIGILSIVPGFIFSAYFLFIIFIAFTTINIGTIDDNTPPPVGFFIFMPISMAIFFAGFFLTTIITIYHVIHISKNETISSNDKLMWILIVLILNWIGDVAYWYLKIWKDDKKQSFT